MKKTPLKLSGFTLLEMMLVLVIMSTIVVMIANYTVLKTGQVRRDRAALQMQQILNAGLAYYINNSQWPGWVATSGTCPTALTQLQSGNYLPSTLKSPYINNPTYTITCNASGVFSVSVTTEVQADANILAGMVPLGNASGLTVTAQVNIPGQNLNNARSVNFAGVYRSGGCVPVPTCPGTSSTQPMVPEIFVAATQVVGTYGANNNPPTVYPITNFTAYAVGPAPEASVPDCFDSSTASCAPGLTGAPSLEYWRVCLDVGTQAGDAISPSNATGTNSPGQWQSIMAITRCSPANESPGSTLSVWQP